MIEKVNIHTSRSGRKRTRVISVAAFLSFGIDSIKPLIPFNLREL
jgi:hypothetical protein